MLPVVGVCDHASCSRSKQVGGLWCSRHTCATAGCRNCRASGRWCQEVPEHAANGRRKQRDQESKRREAHRQQRQNQPVYSKLSTIHRAGQGCFVGRDQPAGSMLLFHLDGHIQCLDCNWRQKSLAGSQSYAINVDSHSGVYWLEGVKVLQNEKVNLFFSGDEIDPKNEMPSEVSTIAHCETCHKPVDLTKQYVYVPPGTGDDKNFVPNCLASTCNDNAWIKGGVSKKKYIERCKDLNNAQIVTAVVTIAKATRLVPAIHFLRSLKRGDEIFLTYDYSYWISRYRVVSSDQNKVKLKKVFRDA